MKDGREIVLAEALADLFNPMGNDLSVFAEKFCHGQHRTLQQNTFRAFVALLRQWADDFDNRNFDARNEATCRAAKKIIEQLGDNLHVPMI